MRCALCIALTLAAAGTAHAQAVDRRYAEEPPDGVALPATSIAGTFDARATVLNSAGLAMMNGPALALALDFENADVAAGSGPGFGLYLASDFFGDRLPKTGAGIALEWLRPSRSRLSPDPGDPFRLTISHANALGRYLSLGVAFHYFFASGALHGVDTFDAGLSLRPDNHFALGVNVRDLDTADIEGTPVQRRYEAEAMVRPLGTDALELSVGGRIGETRGDVDGWVRVGVRALQGAYVVAAVESRALHAIDDSPAGLVDADVRETRATVGLELSLGQIGLAAYGTGVRAPGSVNHALGGTFVATIAATPRPSVLPADDHIERVELTGEIGVRELTQLVLRLRGIANDRSARGVVVLFDGASPGWATLQELRNELLALKAAHKKVFAYMVSGSTRDYYVASAADKIYIDPAGELRLLGMAGQSFYFRGLFDQVGITPQFEKIAEYKSAPEMFTETGATPIAAKMRDELFDSLWQQWLTTVATARHLTTDELGKLVDNGPYTAGELAENTKLVDGVAPPDKVAQLIMAELGGVYSVGEPPVTQPDRWERPEVAVIYIDGDITDGVTKTIPLIGTNLAGGETVVAALLAAREDPLIKAIILRIDSPGGSALASELIAREVFATRGKKPIICSMSNLAASGGYFVAAGCDVILAEPMTITGSIGIFFGKFDLSGLVKKLGISIETFKRGLRSDAESMFRPYTTQERTALLRKLRYAYGRFVGAIAEGRKLTKDAVDAVGRGHVYSGEQAKPLALVDRFGGLGDALDEARKRVGLPLDAQLEILEYPKISTSLLGVIGKLLTTSQPELPLSELPVFKALVRAVPPSMLLAPESAQMRLPYELELPE